MSDDDAEEGTMVVVKRAKTAVAVPEPGETGHFTAAGIKRTSGLLAPNMKLTGHEAAVHGVKFNPKGTLLASAGADKLVYLWNVYGDCDNVCAMKGHSTTVLDLCWTRDGEHVLTAAADRTGALYDVAMGKRIKRFRGHQSFVNSVCGSRRGEPLVVTGSDDCTAKVWDMRVKSAVSSLGNDYQLLSVAFSDDSSQVFTAGIDNSIHCWDLRQQKVVYDMVGHEDSITGISLSPDGSFLLSNAMDNTLRVWDVRPYVSERRHVSIMGGHQHDFQQLMLRCSWSADGGRVSAGSSDSFVYVWDVQQKRIFYKLPGHQGAVHEVDFHPTEPIIASCSQDKVIFVGEIDA